MNDSIALHATAVSIQGEALIITGPSASGKSDLAMRLIDRGAQLIADDNIVIMGDHNAPIAAQSEHHINALEIRGVGIIAMDCVNKIPLKIIVQLTDTYEHIPSPLPLISYGHYVLPCLKISPFEISAPIKIEQALANFKSLTNISNRQ